jgi:hypothetical protein
MVRAMAAMAAVAAAVAAAQVQAHAAAVHRMQCS